MLVHTLFTNKRFQWDVVGHYIFSDQIIDGVILTIELTLIGLVVQINLGTVVAVMRLSANPITRLVSTAYVWFFRGTPLLVQLLFWFNIAALYPRLSLGVPFGPELYQFDVNSVLTTFTAALIGLGLYETAYTSEIIRAGILAIDKGQTEAALSVGMTKMAALRRVVLPQALKVILPPLGNSAISLLKLTSLASVISVSELAGTAENIYSSTFETIPMLIVISLWYLGLSTVITILIGLGERLAGTRENVVGSSKSKSSGGIGGFFSFGFGRGDLPVAVAPGSRAGVEQ